MRKINFNTIVQLQGRLNLRKRNSNLWGTQLHRIFKNAINGKEDRDEAQQQIIDRKRDVREAEKELYQAFDPAFYLDKLSDLIEQYAVEEPITTPPATENGDPSEQEIDSKKQPDSSPSTEPAASQKAAKATPKGR